MADFNENVLGFAAHTPKFLKQRKIAYVDNPFDETASHSMVQKYEYMNFRRDENGAGSPRVFGQSSEDKTSSNKGQDGLWSCGRTDLALSEQDWSFLFSPVQVYTVCLYVLNRLNQSRLKLLLIVRHESRLSN